MCVGAGMCINANNPGCPWMVRIGVFLDCTITITLLTIGILAVNSRMPGFAPHSMASHAFLFCGAIYIFSWIHFAVMTCAAARILPTDPDTATKVSKIMGLKS